MVKVEEQLGENKTEELWNCKQLLKAWVRQQANNSSVLTGMKLLHNSAEFRLSTCTSGSISFPYHILLFYLTILFQWIWVCFINACISLFNFCKKLIHKKTGQKFIFCCVMCICSSHWLSLWQELCKIYSPAVAISTGAELWKSLPFRSFTWLKTRAIQIRAHGWKYSCSNGNNPTSSLNGNWDRKVELR